MARRQWPVDAKITVGVLAAVLALEIAFLPDSNEGRRADANSATTSTVEVTATSGSDSNAPMASSGPNGVEALVVATPGDDAGYDRDLFVHWIDADGDGCDTRCEVLERQRRTDLPGLPNGGWLSPYDGYSTPDPSELDIDHVVPLAEAWISGASTWDAAMRTAFANDLDSGELLAVTTATNQSKGDRDPARWQPPSRDAWCAYAYAWVDIKMRWNLTADEAEVNALRNMLVGCPP